MTNARDRIDAEIRRRFEQNGLAVAGWALVVDLQRIDPTLDPAILEPLEYQGDYMTGPGTSLFSAIGLAQALGLKLSRMAARDLGHGDEPDEAPEA